jgi:hypothetical protein
LVNRFGVLVARKVELDANLGTLTIRGQTSPSDGRKDGRVASPPLASPDDLKRVGSHASIADSANRTDALAGAAGLDGGDEDARASAARSLALEAKHADAVLPLTAVSSIVIARNTRSHRVHSHTVHISTLVQFFESLRLSFDSAFECNEWLVLLRRAVAAAKEQAQRQQARRNPSCSSLKDMAASMIGVEEDGRDAASLAGDVALPRRSSVNTSAAQAVERIRAKRAGTKGANAETAIADRLRQRWDQPYLASTLLEVPAPASRLKAAKQGRRVPNGEGAKIAPSHESDVLPVPTLWAVDSDNQVLCCDFFLAHLMNDSGGCAEHLIQPFEAMDDTAPPATLVWARAPPLERVDSWGRKRLNVVSVAASPGGLVWVIDKEGMAHVLVNSDGRAWFNRGHGEGHRALQADLARARWMDVPEQLFVFAGGFRERLARVSLSLYAAWAVTTAGTLLVRAGVSVDTPGGLSWQRLECDDRITNISIMDGAVLALTCSGNIYTRVGFSDAYPFGTHWLDASSALAAGTLGVARPDPIFDLNVPSTPRLGGSRKVQSQVGKDGKSPKLNTSSEKSQSKRRSKFLGRASNKTDHAADQAHTNNGRENGTSRGEVESVSCLDVEVELPWARRRRVGLTHNHNMVVILNCELDSGTSQLQAARRNHDSRIGMRTVVSTNGDFADVRGVAVSRPPYTQ